MKVYGPQPPLASVSSQLKLKAMTLKLGKCCEQPTLRSDDQAECHNRLCEATLRVDQVDSKVERLLKIIGYGIGVLGRRSSQAQ